MTDVREETQQLLADRPDLASALEHLVDIDADGKWDFHDTSLDSGEFGEIVAQDIVTQQGEAYRLVDREATAAALDGEIDPESSKTVSEVPTPDSLSELSVRDRLSAAVSDPLSIGFVLLGLVLIILVRTVFAANAVFRNGTVVLTGNDPYRYRYWVEFLLDSQIPAFSPTGLGALPEYVTNHDTLMIVTAWWWSALFGGSAHIAGLVLAWYPVVAAVVAGLAVYLLAVQVTGDRRIGLATLALYAVIPVNAYRTMIGFADHHAFDYVWLALTLLSLGILATARGTDRMYRGDILAGVLGLSIGVAAQTLAWRGGPLLILPVGLYVLSRTLLDVREGRSPVQTSGPLLAGLGGAAVLSVVSHLGWGWLPTYRAAAPLLLVVGSAFVIAIGEANHRIEYSAKATAVEIFSLGGVGFAALWVTVPAVSSGLSAFVTYMQTYTGSGIAETQSLIGGEGGLFLGPLLLFGFILFLSLPYLALLTVRGVRTDTPHWLLLSIYGWYFLLLSLIQLRFAGEFSVVIAPVAGIGFVDLAARLDITQQVDLWGDSDHTDRFSWSESDREGSSLSLPDGRTVGTLLVLFILIASFSFVQIPVKQSQLTTADGEYETATWMNGYAAERGWTYPDNYVFSPWSNNMMLNYFVNSESRDYGYAKEHYTSFLASDAPKQWYDRLHDRVGFVTVRDRGGDPNPQTVYSRLTAQYGSQTEDTAAVSHYRAVYVDDGSQLTVFTLVPGATLTGQAAANESFVVETAVDVPGAEFTYRHLVTAGPDGQYAVTVPYPGSYEIGNHSVSVSATAVREGENVSVSSPP
ncbi:laminin G [Halosimplex pelagicum]|uniref:dolichyl-phosphooligosaccharide-protein glycotransferase n=1 Tax=Halosimplex pelagicum TaxID=869886 RepID=A0A7D5TBF3_9EURY|nr:laminin G [Halosimplex pelagicum]QLH81255.1 laminin G [Halosimplex pelagicum]